MLELLNQYKHIPLVMRPNRIKIPTTYLGMDDEGMNTFNKIYDWAKDENFFELELTPSGSFSSARGHIKFPAWKLLIENAYIHMYILLAEGMWHLSFSDRPPRNEKTSTTIFPQQAFAKFEAMCRKHNINLADY